MSFESVTSTIIKEAINSAIYIDDNVLLPYESEQDNVDKFVPKDLYNSFRFNDCSLDFYRYNGENINTLERFLYFNRDLLILDWHLDSNNEDNLSPTLELLSKAASAKNLHFCVVYTSENTQVLQEKVIYNIASYFSGLSKTIQDQINNEFIELLDLTGKSQDEIDTIRDELSAKTKELFFAFKNVDRNKEVSKTINEIITKFTTRNDFQSFLEKFELPVSAYKERLLCLGFALNKAVAPDEAKYICIELPSSSYSIKLNNLFIKAYSKVTVGAQIYEDFKQTLINESNIFLSLLGLELRNRFRESSGFIGKDLETVNHIAFLYHRKHHFEGHEDLFNDFLKDIWKEQVASFLLEKDITLFSIIDEFKEVINAEELLKKFDKSNEVNRKSLAQLNYVYNKLSINRKPNDEVRFGDLFYIESDNKELIFLLCITPHCDCLRPEKIKNNYFFVEGKNINLATGINEKGDGDYISFIKKNGELLCIDWMNGTEDCKPFSLYLPNHRMNEEKYVKTSMLGVEMDLKYLCTIKENYCQRIANKAFFYPLRVGIDFASFKAH